MSGLFQLFDALSSHVEDALRASISRFGVLVPVVKDQHGNTIDGHHRARIADALDVTYRVDVVQVTDDDQAKEIARTLNSDRRHLTEDQRREMVTSLRKDGHSYRAIAGALGVSEPTVRRDIHRQEIASGDAIEQPDRVIRQGGGSYPSRRPALVATRDVDQAVKAQQALIVLGDLAPAENMTQTEVLKLAARQNPPEPVSQTVPPPPGKYRCLVVDPPWPMTKLNLDARPNQGPTLDYPVLSLEEIADESVVPVRTVADDDCHLYLWVTHKYLPAGLELMAEWGFHYQCVMTWRKNVGFTPFSWMYDTEHVLFGHRGNLKLTQLGLRLSFDAKVSTHSVKPDEFYERVLAASPGPRVDMFARREREGFTSWGNEVNHALV